MVYCRDLMYRKMEKKKECIRRCNKINNHLDGRNDIKQEPYFSRQLFIFTLSTLITSKDLIWCPSFLTFWLQIYSLAPLVAPVTFPLICWYLTSCFCFYLLATVCINLFGSLIFSFSSYLTFALQFYQQERKQSTILLPLQISSMKGSCVGRFREIFHISFFVIHTRTECDIVFRDFSSFSNESKAISTLGSYY